MIPAPAPPARAPRRPKRIAFALVLALAPFQTADAFRAAPDTAAARAPFAGPQLALRADLRLVEGRAYELVYRQTGALLSELSWDISGLAMLGAVGSLRVAERVHLNAGVWGGLNRGAGQMVDLDWMREDIAEWTHRSESTVEIETAGALDVNAHVRTAAWPCTDLFVVVGLKFSTWAWTDSAGAYVYSSDHGFRDEIGHFDGVNAIDYEQQIHMPYVGLAAIRAGSRLNVGGQIWFSPLVSGSAYDHHKLRDMRFRETFRGGHAFGAGLDIATDPRAPWFFGLAVDGQLIPEIKGETTIEYPDGRRLTVPDGGGMKNGVIAVGLFAGRRL